MSSLPLHLTISSSCCHNTPDLHSFPPRRSSDLERPPVEARGALPRQVLRREGRGGGGAGRAGSPRGGRTASSTTFSTKDRKSTRLNSSHGSISYAVFCLKKKK